MWDDVAGDANCTSCGVMSTALMCDVTGGSFGSVSDDVTISATGGASGVLYRDFSCVIMLLFVLLVTIII